MSTIKLWCRYLLGPRLYKVYDERYGEGLYDPGRLEKWGDHIINTVNCLWSFGIYTSPFIATVLYRRGHFVMDGAVSVAKWITGFGLVLVFTYIVRGLGRATSPEYRTFLNVLDAAQRDLNKDTKKALSKYDFEFSAWPVEFRWSDNGEDGKKQRLFMDRPSHRRSTVELIFALPCRIISYVVASTVGLKLMYPGSTSLLNYLLFQVLLQGRVKLVEESSGQRFKLQTKDNNTIDSMFVDKRNRQAKGSTLVICSEGNAGFYEIGIMATPIEAGYSVLGWNHPGFGGSSGSPYPLEELNAIDCVMQFAIHHLGFQPENIILFGWSIGGFSTTWAAMNYPDVKGVILDGTFDDVLPLATSRMPVGLEPIIRRTIRDYLNLNNQEQLVKYPGPIRLIRRTEDEVICTVENRLSTNRGNNLLVHLLKFRYPLIVDDQRINILEGWLAADTTERTRIWKHHAVEENLCTSTIISYMSEHSSSYPMLLGEGFSDQMKAQMCLFLASKYLTDFRSSHCTPLPVNLFEEPWGGLSPDVDYAKI